MVVAFLPFAGFISVTDVLDSTRYLYAAEAGVALTFGLVLATTSVRRSRSLAFLPFLLLGIGSGGLLLRNEAPWREAGNMVSATIESARSGPIQVFGVPLYSFEGGFTFGPDVDYLARYPSGAVNVQLGNPVLRDRQLLYWNGNELRPVTAPTESWTGSETMETWSWADAVDASAADRDGVEIRSRTEDPFAISPVLNLDGSSAQVLSLSLDLRSPCQQGQVIWHTTSGVDYLTYFDLRMGLNTYVILAPSQLRTETVDKVRLDPLLCLATAVVYRVSIGGVLR